MGRQNVEAFAWTKAPPEVVYRLLVDGLGWPAWSGHDRAELVTRGVGDGDGVGAVRVLHRGRVASREQIVELVRDQRLGYVLLDGLPLRDYRANVDLTSKDRGTRIRWSSSFVPKWPGTGWIYRLALQRFMAQTAASLARHAGSLTADGAGDALVDATTSGRAS